MFIHLLFTLLITPDLHAQSSKCTTEIESLGAYNLQQFETRQKDCVIRLNSRDGEKSRRNFQFFENGLFEVYTIIERKGFKSGSPGSRSYFIIPTSQGLRYEKLAMMTKIEDSSGLTWLMDEKGNLTNDNGCRIQQSDLTSWENEARVKSGFFIQSCPGSLVFDLGFKRGEPPNLVNPSNKISVRDHFGRSCEIKNSDVLKYDSKDRFSHTWKYKTNQELKEALAKIKGCQDLAQSFEVRSSPGSHQSHTVK